MPVISTADVLTFLIPAALLYVAGLVLLRFRRRRRAPILAGVISVAALAALTALWAYSDVALARDLSIMAYVGGVLVAFALLAIHAGQLEGLSYLSYAPRFMRRPLVTFHDQVYARFRFWIAYLSARLLSKEAPKTILCYPRYPDTWHTIYRVCHVLGYRITTDPTQDYDLAINVDYRTVHHADSPGEQERLSRLPAGMLNAACHDTGKSRVDRVFSDTFGYSLEVDPTTYTGPCVRKSSGNGLNDGVLVTCPISSRDPNHLYQVLIHNELGSLVRDIATPIVNHTIPFAYFKYRKLKDRFVNRSTRLEIIDPDDVFSAREQALILEFADRMDIDIGELDILRDAQTHLLWIVDANVNPNAPPFGLPRSQFWDCLKMWSRAFETAYVQNNAARVDAVRMPGGTRR